MYSLVLMFLWTPKKFYVILLKILQEKVMTDTH